MTRSKEDRLRQKREDLTREFKHISNACLDTVDKKERRPYFVRRKQINAEILEITKRLKEVSGG